jgi:hypothetical protein
VGWEGAEHRGGKIGVIQEVPQRLKPDFFWASHGTAESVPFPFLPGFAK